MTEDHIAAAAAEAAGQVKYAAGGLAGDAQDAADSIAETASGAAAHAAEALRHTAETVKAKAGTVGGKVYEAGATAGGYVGSTIKKQPLLSLIGIAAVGYLVGYLIHAPSSPFAQEPRYRRVIRRWG